MAFELFPFRRHSFLVVWNVFTAYSVFACAHTPFSCVVALFRLIGLFSFSLNSFW
jgi:hypothetical protein